MLLMVVLLLSCCCPVVVLLLLLLLLLCYTSVAPPSLRSGVAPRSTPPSLRSGVATLDSNPRYTPTILTLTLIGELVLHTLILTRIPYTEIDYSTYCQQVSMVASGERDYLALTGDTGPCPYPAGYVWVFSGLCQIADGTQGVPSLLPVQIVFVGIYILTLLIVYDIYISASFVVTAPHPSLSSTSPQAVSRTPYALPPYVFLLLSASHRIHSIYSLRLFNDPVAMLFLYAALALLLRHVSWVPVMILFSIAVSIKMNVLLFAPALGLILVKSKGSLLGALPYLALAAAVQIGLAAPFLMENPSGYVGRAFDLGRVFMYKWTVNLKFLPESVFVSKTTASLLLAGHGITLAAFAWTRWLALPPGGLSALLLGSATPSKLQLSPYYMARTLFACNFVGIVFSRTLHYQFYSWYFHTIPFLLWATEYTFPAKIALFAAIEIAFNVFPATPISSALLVVAHLAILVGLFFTPSVPDRIFPFTVLRPRPHPTHAKKE